MQSFIRTAEQYQASTMIQREAVRQIQLVFKDQDRFKVKAMALV